MKIYDIFFGPVIVIVLVATFFGSIRSFFLFYKKKKSSYFGLGMMFSHATILSGAAFVIYYVMQNFAHPEYTSLAWTMFMIADFPISLLLFLGMFLEKLPNVPNDFITWNCFFPFIFYFIFGNIYYYLIGYVIGRTRSWKAATLFLVGALTLPLYGIGFLFIISALIVVAVAGVKHMRLPHSPQSKGAV